MEKILKSKFDENEFVKFVTKLLNLELNDKNVQIKKLINKKECSFDNIQEIKDVAKYEVNDKEVLVSIVKVKSSPKEKVNSHKHCISEHLEFHGIEGGIFAFYSEKNDIWRISFIKRDLSFDKKTIGMKIVPTKRYSYIIDPNLNNYNIIRQLKKLYLNDVGKFSLEDIEKSFDADILMKDFYEVCKTKFLELGEIIQDDVFKNEIESLELKPKKVAMKIISQLIFWYILDDRKWIENESFTQKALKKIYSMIPSDFFRNEGKKGILDLFDTYNFTMNENEPFEKEIAIDPEMLGKIFESLLEVDERKSKGVFYTPREIVHYMCQECLINYIHNDTNIDKTSLEVLIKYGDIIKDADIRNSRKENYKLPKIIIDNLELIDEKLKTVTIIDPSVGSGAFVLGMLNEIVKVRGILTEYISKDKNPSEAYYFKKERSSYNLKKHAMRNSIFAVDIETSAVEITKLRLWLSLVVDVDDKIVNTLPNLDYNIMIGNSLIDKLYDGRLFDIVIGNPPYLGEKGNKHIFRPIQQTSFGGQYYQGKMDLFYFFFHLGLNLVKEKGIVGYITTNYYITATGGKKLRTDIKNRSDLLLLLNFNEFKVFESTRGQHNIITIMQKGKFNEICISMNVDEKGNADSIKLSDILNKIDSSIDVLPLKQDSIFEGEENYIRPKGINLDNLLNYSEEFANLSSVLKKIGDSQYNLGAICNIKQGIVSGADKVTDSHISKYGGDWVKGEGIFVLSKEELDNIKLNEQEQSIIKKFYKNSQVEQYNIRENNDANIIYITKDINIDNVPNIINHLEKYKEIISRKRETMQGKLPWYCLHWSRDKEILESDEKIVNPRRCKSNKFALETDKRYEQSDLMISVLKKSYKSKFRTKYILAFLNSKLCRIWLLNKGKMKGDMMELYGAPLSEIPIKDICLDTQKKIESIVDIIINTSNEKLKYDNMNKIDYILFKVYNLSKEEILYINSIS